MNQIIDKNKGTIEKSLKTIAGESLLDQGNISLYLFENRNMINNPISVYDLTITPKIIAKMREFAKGYLSSVLSLIPKGGIPYYNPEAPKDICTISSKKIELLQKTLKYITGGTTCDTYDRNKVNEDKLKAWVFRFEVAINEHHKQILFFQRFQPAKMLEAKKFTIFERGGRFHLLEGNIFSVNREMDFLFYEDVFVITKMFSFEKIFNYEDFYKKNAIDLVDDLADKAIPKLKYEVEFTDIDSVHTKINENTPLAHKFYSARTHNYFKRINFKKLVNLDKRYKFKLNLDLDEERWIIDDKADLKIVARILNDDYERSQITPNDYIALSKERPKRPKPATTAASSKAKKGP